MLRVPKSDPANRRFEFRLAGADANPYLLTAFTIAALSDGMLAGIQPTLPKIAEGSVATMGKPIPARGGYKQSISSTVQHLPVSTLAIVSLIPMCE